MTVCISAIFDNSTIVGASDRMLTAGDIQFQPSQPKIWTLTTSIVGMIAGDVGIHAEIFNKLYIDIRAHIDKNPKKWISVSEVAQTYSTYYHQLKFSKGENEVLFPLGLDRKSFIEEQNKLNPDLVKMIAERLNRIVLPDSGIIFTGIDETGPHLYVVENGKVRCEDKVGFAAIGAGYWHADSHFMFSGFTPKTKLYKALQTTYFAKKKAEVAPGVGSETDMFIIGPTLGSYISLKDEIVKNLDTNYKSYLKAIKSVENKIDKKTEGYISDILSKESAHVQKNADELEIEPKIKKASRV
jgi:20S proteasome alpha/beta subunit